MSELLSSKTNSLFSERSKQRRKLRSFKEHLARYLVAVGGIGVIAAIVLIFVYLLYVVFPIFLPASMEPLQHYSLEAQGKGIYLALEEQNEVALRIDEQGNVLFFATHSGKTVHKERLPLSAGTQISSMVEVDANQGLLAFGLDNGTVLLAKPQYQISYPNDVRHITPKMVYPFGDEALILREDGSAVETLAVGNSEESISFLSYNASAGLVLNYYLKEEDLMEEGFTLEEQSVAHLDYGQTVSRLQLDAEQQFAFVATAEGVLTVFSLADKSEPEMSQRVHLLAGGARLSRLDFLLGSLSLLVSDSKGTISQWFMSRDAQNAFQLTHIRQFEPMVSGVQLLHSEQRRKGFVALDQTGQVALYHSTSERLVLSQPLLGRSPQLMALSPRANRLLLESDDGVIDLWSIDNEHPEISWSALWDEVWYESYSEPDYVWQSSSASNDFEPKFSLVPLTFGTIKAAFYAMLMAMPLAIFGAIYTAYFMAPSMRKVVKPTIEIMEALPTVILGFLAGLWLAPFAEANLPGIFTLLLLMPLGMLLFAYAWTHGLPKRVQQCVPDGWQAALLIPVVIVVGWGSIALSPTLEGLLFDGNMQMWMQHELGIGFDQRNALIVGLAMGFAVIPTIFSITEDAIFSVPKHLSYGSLALGATPWQTLIRVVLLTASPGIFSAVMIGLGRAVGETMIVLMATGNTPIMDFSVFEGMRTLSANIAVEVPEAEVNSSHYRILFLAALVLFMVTFVFNSVAELVRQRLRDKYSNL
ncbi:MAG: ABC transporter permease subunit [Gammaproteobacteria bacterium]|nr:ABC transporter permease subunit [Gammaproteobacteria bacterium]